MERSNSAPPYVPPVNQPNRLSEWRNASHGPATNWQATEKTSFESALNRIRDQNVREESTIDDSNMEISEVKPDDQRLDEVAIEGSAEKLQAVTDGADNEAESTPQAISPASVGSAVSASESSQSQLLDMAMHGTELSAATMIDGLPGDTQGAASGSIASSARGSTLTAETMGQMMSRLERAPGAHDGQWRFGVLNEHAGVTALQLQRSINGGWRVNVSFNEASQIDEQRHAEELKAALLKEGHDVDSVEISRQDANLAPGDD